MRIAERERVQQRQRADPDQKGEARARKSAAQRLRQGRVEAGLDGKAHPAGKPGGGERQF